nr:hypothetical protein [Mycobacterium sp.]
MPIIGTPMDIKVMPSRFFTRRVRISSIAGSSDGPSTPQLVE